MDEGTVFFCSLLKTFSFSSASGLASILPPPWCRSFPIDQWFNYLRETPLLSAMLLQGSWFYGKAGLSSVKENDTAPSESSSAVVTFMIPLLHPSPILFPLFLKWEDICTCPVGSWGVFSELTKSVYKSIWS